PTACERKPQGLNSAKNLPRRVHLQPPPLAAVTIGGRPCPPTLSPMSNPTMSRKNMGHKVGAHGEQGGSARWCPPGKHPMYQ
ncbi:hypothetical protein PanWU01x14_232260, partial [Parasponia andersonii]